MITYVLMFICIYEMFICIHDNICTRDELGYNMMHVCMYACMYVLYICTHFVYTHTPSLSPPLPLHPPPPPLSHLYRLLLYRSSCPKRTHFTLVLSLSVSLPLSLTTHIYTGYRCFEAAAGAAGGQGALIAWTFAGALGVEK